MSRTLKFYGASDDLLEIDGTRGEEPDEIGAYDGPRTVKVYDRFGNCLLVTALYSPASNGCWMIGISQADEDQPLPTWPMTWAATGYTTTLTIEVPDDAVVAVIT